MLEVRLKELLAKNNMTITELSNITSTNRASLTQLTNGESKMVKFETLDKIISTFNIDNLSDLFRIVNSGKVIATLAKQKSTKEFEINFSIDFEPVRGEKSAYNLPIKFTFSKLKNKIYILEGTPQKEITATVKSVFSLSENTEIVEFIKQFWGELLSAPNGYSPVLNLSSLEDLKSIKDGTKIQIFFTIPQLPWLSKIIDAVAFEGKFIPTIFPDETIKGQILPKPLVEKSKNQVIFIADLYKLLKS